MRRELEGHWEQITEKARLIWPQLSDRDVRRANGCEDVLYEIIQQRFGGSPEVIARQIALLNI